MVLCLRLTVRRIVLRTLLLSLLAIGIASAARVKHTVDLPTNPLHWQRYLKTLRSVLATQRLALRYEVPAPTPGATAGVKYADSEDYFRAAPAYNKPADSQTGTRYVQVIHQAEGERKAWCQEVFVVLMILVYDSARLKCEWQFANRHYKLTTNCHMMLLSHSLRVIENN